MPKTKTVHPPVVATRVPQAAYDKLFDRAMQRAKEQRRPASISEVVREILMVNLFTAKELKAMKEEASG